jgi:serine/threonine-protein kinase
MPLVSGAMVAGFNIVRQLGCGQIGELYLVEHARLPRRHALEILPADVSADPEYRERFNRESDLAAALWHPHIVSLHDRGEFEGQLWLSMDYVDGADAAQLLSDRYPNGMPPDAAVEIVSAIADALDYAHDHGLMHRCVKPSNILITDRRRVLLAGFGVAQRLDDINSLTQTNPTDGTVCYAAPEQLMGESIDGRADQYALASTAFHLLTGSAPFAHANPAVVISRHLNESPPKPGDVRPELADFDESFARALAKAPNNRFSRCQDFAKLLEAKHSKHSNLRDVGAIGAATGPAQPPAPNHQPATATPPNNDTNTTAPTAQAVPAPRDIEAENAFAPTDVLPRAGISDVMRFPEPAVMRFPEPDVMTPQEPAVTRSAEPAVPPGATTDEAPATSHRHRPPLAATVALTTMVVVPVGLLIVMGLHSTPESQSTPTSVQTPSLVTKIPPPAPAPAAASPLPNIIAPAPMTTPPPSTPPSSPATIMQPASTPSPADAIGPLITKPPSPIAKPPSSPRTTPPVAVDSRPAVGMPCGPQQTGSTTLSNSGVPVSCVGTPGGFAWE